MIPGTTSWPGATLPVLVAAAVLFIPGTIFARFIGARWLTALSVGPVVSTSILSVAGIVAGLGISWGVVPAAAATVLAWLVAWVVGRFLRRSRWAHPAETSPAPSGQSWNLVPLATLAGVAFAGVVTAAVLVNVSHTPDHFPQHPDTIFHLAATRWMVTHQDISVLHAAGVSTVRGTGFYPAALHGIAATVSMVTGTNVVVAMSACVLVTAGVVWPLGVMALARTTFGSTPQVVGAAAVASVLFTAYPFSIMGVGVLWPNLFGQALLPATVAVALAAVARFTRQPSPLVRPGQGLVLTAVSLPGLALGHPNALVSFLVVGYLALVLAAVRHSWEQRRRPLRAVGTLAAVVMASAVLALGSYLLRPANMVATTRPGPEKTLPESISSTLFFAPLDMKPQVLLAILVGVGVIAVLVRFRGARWVVASLVVFMGLYFVNVANDSPTARLFTWPWYNVSIRLAAIAVFPAVLCATAGFVWVGELASRPFRRRTSWGPLIATTAVVAAFAVGTMGYVGAHRDFLRGYFFPGTARSWASDEELRALHTLAAHIPPDSLTAANPWNGGTYLYVVSGRRLLVPTEKSLVPGDRELLAARLDKAGTDPKVCEAARRQHVEYAITGGVPFLWAGERRVALYSGIDDVTTSKAFTKVATAGPYTLYRLTRCATG